VYFEEVDLSLRAYQAGWGSACATSATCLHVGGGCSHQVKAARLFYSLRSRIFYAYKHFSYWSAATVFVTTYTIEFLSRSVAALARRSASDAVHIAKGYRMLWGSTPEILKQIRKGGRG
jgi:GT2 family glycosyltransferase